MRRDAIVSLCLCAAACAASTSLVGTWRDPAYAPREAQRVLVIGITPSVQNQQMFEGAVAERLTRLKIQAFKGFDVLPKGQMANQETLAAAMKKLNVDVVLVTRLVTVRNETEFVPTSGSTAFTPNPIGADVYPYYASGYTDVYATGYVTQTQAVYLETNAYDARAPKLVWSGLTRTFDYQSIDSMVTSAAKGITNALLDAGVI